MQRSKWQELFIFMVQGTIWSPAGVRKKFFWLDKKCYIIHSNWCLMQTFSPLFRPSRCGLLLMMLHPVFLQQFFSVTLLSLPLATSCLSISFLRYFSSYSFSPPPLLMNCIADRLGALRRCVCPFIPTVCWPPASFVVISSAQLWITTFTDVLFWIAETSCCFDNAANETIKWKLATSMLIGDISLRRVFRVLG